MASAAAQMDAAFWSGRLISAFKTGLACFAAGMLLLKGKEHVSWLAFPVFSFIITVTVVGESTLGRGLHDAMRILIGTIQSTLMALTVLKLLYPHTFSVMASISCISATSFLIVYPKTTHVLSKRVALAQTAIIYMSVYLQKEKMNRLSFPVRVGTTTMMGTLCATISLLIPIPPRFACYEMKQQTKIAAHTVAETFKTMIIGFCCDDAGRFSSVILQAKALLKSGSSIISSLKDEQADIRWELNCFRSMSSIKLFAEGVGKLKLHLVGMNMAFQSGHISQSSDMVRSMLQDSLFQLSEWSMLALKLAGSPNSNMQSQKQIILEEGRELLDSFDESLRTARQKVSFFGQEESMDDLFEELLWRKSHLYSKAGSRKVYTNISGNFQSQIATMSFLYSMKLFLIETMAIIDENKPKFSQIAISNDLSPAFFMNAVHPETDADLSVGKHEMHGSFPEQFSDFSCEDCDENIPEAQYMKNLKHNSKYCRNNSCSKPAGRSRFIRWLAKAMQFSPDTDQLTVAMKVSIAMGMAAYVGLAYDPEHSHWADISIAMGIGNYQKGSFRISNMRLQGTVCGSIYGYLLAMVTHQVPAFSLAAMVPWVILTSFLRKSKMYGYSGSVSAVVGAMILLGRKHEGSLEKFAMIRITETFLGLSCFVLVEILLWPRRAVVILEKELARSFLNLQGCAAEVFAAKRKRVCQKCHKASVRELKEKAAQLRRGISRQNALINEAKLEPEFWYGPFQGSIYSKMTEIQSRIVDLLQVLISCSLDLKIAANSCEETAINNFIRLLIIPTKVLEDDCIATFEFLHEILLLKQHKEFIRPSDNSPPGPKPFKSKDTKAADTENHPRNFAAKIESFITKIPILIKSRLWHHPTLPSTFTDPHAGSFRKHLNLHSLMELFESHYEETVGRLTAPSAKPVISTLNSSVILSFSALIFCVHGLLKETLELEKAVIELLQTEHPWILFAL